MESMYEQITTNIIQPKEMNKILDNMKTQWK